MLQNIQIIILLILAFLIAFFLVRIIRFIINFIIYTRLSIRHRTPKKLRYKEKNNKNNKIFAKPDEELLKKKENGIQKYSKKSKDIDLEEQEIVGIAEPKGFWTEMVTKQKISWLRAMVGSQSYSNNFWQNMIKAQQQVGKVQNRGRGGRD